MAPTSKKDFKKKLKKKKKKKKKVNVVPIDPRAIESDWWDTFWHKNSCVAGSVVPADEEEGFKHFFRMSKKTFEYICSLVKEDLISRPPSGLINIEGRLISVEKQVAIAVRRLASGNSQVLVGSSFGVGQSTVSQVTWRFVEAMEDRARHHLKWPDQDRMEAIKSRFEDLCGLPNCCGAMDTTHIVMTLPAVQTSDDWCDEAKNYSMLLQGVVDHETRFVDIVTGFPGGMNVPTLLRFSGFHKLCKNGERLNGKARVLADGAEIREYVVGGSFYPLLPWLVTPPFEYESKFESARSLAKRALSQLKGSWRILSKVMWRPDKQKLPSIILVCCLLHNIIIDCGDMMCVEEVSLPHHDSNYSERSCEQTDPLGRSLKENLVKYLHLDVCPPLTPTNLWGICNGRRCVSYGGRTNRRAIVQFLHQFAIDVKELCNGLVCFMELLFHANILDAISFCGV